MAKLLVFVAILIGITLSTATAVPSSQYTAFQIWLATFDSSKAVAAKSAFCTSKPNGLYPNEPDTCSGSYVACVSGVTYPQNCQQGFVLDADAGNCVNRADATSSACSTYPAPKCDGTNDGLFQPTEACSELYFICVGGMLYIQSCNSGEFFNPATLVCDLNDLSGACSPTKAPAIVPPYGCSDKIVNFAYAINTCSVSFYICTSISAQPTPKSCTVAGTVFDYEKKPAPIDPNSSCISKTTAPGCVQTTTAATVASTTTTTVSTTTTGTTTTGTTATDTTATATTATATVTTGRPVLPTAPCFDCGRV